MARPESTKRAFQQSGWPATQLGVVLVALDQFGGLPVGQAASPRRVHGPSGLGLEHTICEFVSRALWFAPLAE